jgi:hypothetical protein
MAESSVVSTDYGRKVGLGAPVFGMGWDGMGGWRGEERVFQVCDACFSTGRGEAIGGRQAGRQA